MSFRPAAALRTARRFLVPAVPEDFRDRYIEALTANAFTLPLSEVHKEERIGWVEVARPLKTDFDDVNRWLFNQYAVFALRVDQKRIQGSRLAAELDVRVQDWCAANKRERCPSKVKAEIKEQLEAEMLLKTIPKMSTYAVIWNVAEGWLTIACTSTTRLDTFRKLFHRTFGLALTPADPLDLVPTELGCALLDVKATDFAPDAGIDVPELPADALPEGEMRHTEDEESEPCPPHIACEFFLWLWYRSREGRGSVDLPEGKVEFWLDGRIDFRIPGEERTMYSVGGDDPSASAVAMAALAHGGVVKGLGLALRRDDREYAMRLTGAMLHTSALKLPAMVKGGDLGEELYEAAFLYEEQAFLLRCIFAVWAQQRVSGGAQAQSAIRRWLGLELAQKFEADAFGQGLLFARRAA